LPVQHSFWQMIQYMQLVHLQTILQIYLSVQMLL